MTASRRSGTVLPSWKTEAIPHEDIRLGNLSLDTYAINLGRVIQNDPDMPLVYRDARMFFAATYLTQELRSILQDVLTVLVGGRSDRVLQLRTPFGGGKTHTLLALHHLTRSRALLRGVPGLEDLENLPDPGPVRVAVFSGLETGAADRRGNQPETLWGEIASQLGNYNLMIDQDRQKIAPGGAVIAELIGDQPTLILLDEVLTYVDNAKGIGVGESNLGTQTIYFLQRLTEAVAASPRAAMVFSLQRAREEAAGSEQLLEILGRLVQRVNAIREPVSGDEVLRVVQRRLFANPGDQVSHMTVANAYSEGYRMYLQVGGITREEAAYKADQLRNRIIESYPFHPALLDLMSERWNSLPSYQRTRGALQFLATVVNALWQGNMQAHPLIAPGDVPLENGLVRNTFLDQVGERTDSPFHAIIQADLLGADAGARAVDERLARDNPRMQLYRPGTRIATAALLYSFDGRSNVQRGVFEHELLGCCLIPGSPGLDRNVLESAMYGLNDKLLFLHQRGNLYRFEIQPNLNKLIMDRTQRWKEEDIERRMSQEFNNTIHGNAERLTGRRPNQQRDAIIWPEGNENVPDHKALFQIVYLSPQWLYKHMDAEAQQRDMRLYVEMHGNIPRSYHNGLALAAPNLHMVGEAENAVRLLLTLEMLQEQANDLQLTPQQRTELNDRRNRAAGDLKGSFTHMYPTLYVPRESKRPGEIYTLEPWGIMDHCLNRIAPVHTRVKEALHNQLVFDRVQPGKIVELTRLNEQTPLEQQYYSVSDVVANFFSYYSWTHVWDENVVRRAIADGVRSRTFAYVANVRKDAQGNLILSSLSASNIRFGGEVRPDELDMSENAYILSVAYAEQLLKPVVPPADEAIPAPSIQAPAGFGPVETPTLFTPPPVTEGGRVRESGSLPPIPPASRPVAPGRGGRRYRLRVKVSPQQLLDVIQALEKLSNRSVELDIVVTATASPEQPFTANTLHNMVVEPMLEESEVEILEEQVEE
jgi:hypothetical protein